ncbi:MAG: phosphoribosylformylglycinamidine synthase subunit PurQ [Thermogutta sp.]|nr:phosphoribosylformylglycinamidine synthase subunit PurQ [Thermogutta sp.]
MASPRVFILRAPGTNCDWETAQAFERAGARADRVHVRRLLESPAMLRDYQILCIPGGFSYGDDIAAGRILALQLRRRLAAVLEDFHAEDKLILGICNGFQVLLKAGLLLPPGEDGIVPATLAWNDSGRYEDRWVHLQTRTEGRPGPCVFLDGIDRMELPVAHAEGKFVPRDAAALSRLEAGGHLILRYAAPPPGTPCSRTPPAAADGILPFPFNPNGSVADVAGVCDASGRVLGLMPHPERFIDAVHHPRWTRQTPPDPPCGLRIFRNAVRYFA